MRPLNAIRALILVSGVLLISPIVVVLAQVDTGTIAGTVSDASGAIIPGMSVLIQDLSAGTTFELVTNDAGRYVSPPLKPGSYEIRVSLSGFKTAIARVNLDVNQLAVVDFTLEVGEVTEEVTVEATAPLLRTSTSVEIRKLIYSSAQNSSMRLIRPISTTLMLRSVHLERAPSVRRDQYPHSSARPDRYSLR